MPPVPRFAALAVVLAILPTLLVEARAQESRFPGDLPFAGADWKWTAPRELTAPALVPAYTTEFDVATTGTDALVVWTYRNRILATHLGPDGSASAPILLGQQPTFGVRFPRVAWNGERFLVIWTADYSQIEGQFLDRDGFPLGPPLSFEQTAYLPPLIASNGEEFLVTSQRGAAYPSVTVYLVDPGGSIESIPTDITHLEAIASDGDGYLLLTGTMARRFSKRGEAMKSTSLDVGAIEAVVWMGDHYLAVTTMGLLRLDRDGRPLGAPTPLDRLQYGKAGLLSLDGDSALIVDDGNEGSLGSIRLSRVDGDVVTAGVAIPDDSWVRPLLGRAGPVRLFRVLGAVTQAAVDPISIAISSEGPPVSLTAPDQFKFSVVPTTAGFFAAWREQRSSVRVAVIERDGDVTAEAVAIEVPEDVGYGVHLTPAVATSGDVVLVAWFERGLRARRFTSSGEPLDTAPIDIPRAPAGYGDSPAVAWNGETFVLAWPDSTAIRVARLTADGVLLDPEGVAVPAPQSGSFAPSFPSLASTKGVTLLVWQEGAFPYACQITCEIPPPPQLVAMRLDHNLGRLDPEPFLLAPPGHHAFPTAAASGEGFFVTAVHVTNGSAAIRVGADGTIRDVPPIEDLLRFEPTSLYNAETAALAAAEGIAVAGAPGGFVLAASTTGSRHYTEEPVPSHDLRLTFVPWEGAPSLPSVVTPGLLHFPRPEIAIHPDGTMLVLYAGRRDDLGLATRASFQILRPLAVPRGRLAGR